MQLERLAEESKKYKRDLVKLRTDYRQSEMELVLADWEVQKNEDQIRLFQLQFRSLDEDSALPVLSEDDYLKMIAT
jgi:hypothetical protein